MKKYTNKILLIAAAIFLIVITIKFFINVNEIMVKIKQNETKEININQ
jgi:TRAP-type C4-dicarboxylate transport system permease small subunit